MIQFVTQFRDDYSQWIASPIFDKNNISNLKYQYEGRGKEIKEIKEKTPNKNAHSTSDSDSKKKTNCLNSNME
eukprot:CAMPEP_0116899558 /NCGR_PEP_ID=MMETSP0467-20121206/8090_1 /TAXON_ID=283647 /ORGANISM="Mesodinium pulex, Strain SPMC105" /LENGTH=72 /DNA_ID=CAMNT_0004572425 /DNA_START=511 /DNA_END=729 /DNA_ORIENTATION=-